MKKGKIWMVGLIALLMACGLVFAGCGKLTCSNKKNCYNNGSGNSSTCDSVGCTANNGGSSCSCL